MNTLYPVAVTSPLHLKVTGFGTSTAPSAGEIGDGTPRSHGLVGLWSVFDAVAVLLPALASCVALDTAALFVRMPLPDAGAEALIVSAGAGPTTRSGNV